MSRKGGSSAFVFYSDYGSTISRQHCGRVPPIPSMRETVPCCWHWRDAACGVSPFCFFAQEGING